MLGAASQKMMFITSPLAGGSKSMTPFRPQVFLFRMLAGIFVAEAALLAYSFVQCANPRAGMESLLLNERCPRLGQRAENIFEIAIATTLSLLVGAGASTAIQRKPSASDPALPSSQGQEPFPLPQELVQVQESARGLAQESVQEKAPEKKGRPYTKKG